MYVFGDFIWSKFSPFEMKTKCIFVLKYMIICIYTYGSTLGTIHSNVFLHLRTSTLNVQQLGSSNTQTAEDESRLVTFDLQNKRQNIRYHQKHHQV